jgi:hypothetical protein
MLFIILINLNYYEIINNNFNYFLGFYRFRRGEHKMMTFCMEGFLILFFILTRVF